jgi:fructokinase
MFLICGEALYDMFPGPPSATGAIAFDARPGGSPFNVAIGLARLGRPGGLLTGLSTDLPGENLLQILTRERVDTTHLIRTARKTTLVLVGVDAGGQPDYAFYGADSADCGLTGADLPALAPGVTGLHFGSYSIAVAPVADAFADLARRESHRFISLDPNIRPAIEPDMDTWKVRINALLPHVDMLKTSDEDLAALFPGADRGDIAARWLQQGPELVVITRGSEPLEAYTKTGILTLQPPVVDIVDTVGAGDTFQAALLAGVPDHATLAGLTRDQLGEKLAYAAMAAALACTRRGADLPSSSEVEQALEGWTPGA